MASQSRGMGRGLAAILSVSQPPEPGTPAPTTSDEAASSREVEAPSSVRRLDRVRDPVTVGMRQRGAVRLRGIAPPSWGHRSTVTTTGERAVTRYTCRQLAAAFAIVIAP